MPDQPPTRKAPQNGAELTTPPVPPTPVDAHSVMQADRELARLAARRVGAFWLPCPSCGSEFGGHEWTRINDHDDTIPDGDDGFSGKGICPNCTAAGVGCRAWAQLRQHVHHGCSFMDGSGVSE